MDPGQARCGECEVEPLLWRVAEASQRLVAHAAVYAPEAMEVSRLAREHLPEHEWLFLHPLESAFKDLCAAVTRMNGRLTEVLSEPPPLPAS